METERSGSIVPTERELKRLSLSGTVTSDLIRHAQAGDEADRLLTIRQALKKYKKACFWAMLLSTALIMEGYDVVIVSRFRHSAIPAEVHANLMYQRLPHSMAKHSSQTNSVLPQLTERKSSLHRGSLG